MNEPSKPFKFFLWSLGACFSSYVSYAVLPWVQAMARYRFEDILGYFYVVCIAPFMGLVVYSIVWFITIHVQGFWKRLVFSLFIGGTLGVVLQWILIKGGFFGGNFGYFQE